MNNKKLVMYLSERQLEEISKLYEASFDYIPGKKWTSGVILGHPDINSGRIKFVAFRFWEYCILWPGFALVGLLRGALFKNRNRNRDPYGMYSLWDETPIEALKQSTD